MFDGLSQHVYLSSWFLLFRGGGGFCDGFLFGQLHRAGGTWVAVSRLNYGL